MKIHFDLPPGTTAEATTNSVGEITGFVVTPFFHGRRSSSTILLGKVINAQNLSLDEFTLTVSGKTGTVGNNRNKFQSAIPFADMPPEEADKLIKKAGQDDADTEDEEEDEEAANE